MIEIARIPDERKSVLIGKGGKVREMIERCTGTVIEVGDDVKVSGKDSLQVMLAKDMITAIGRGFTPGKANKLMVEGSELRVISFDGETLKKRKRLFGRVIGKDGRTRERIEASTGAAISIYGKTISFIGTPSEVGPAEDAVQELLLGKRHSYAYIRMLAKKSKSEML